jgi:hypothetical protein
MPVKKPQWVGLGTVIANVTTSLGIRPCVSCQRRKELLDKLVPNAAPARARHAAAGPRRPPWKGIK